MYNFNKIRHQEGDQVYMNEYFRKGNKKNYKYIKRRSNNEQKQLLVPYEGVLSNNSNGYLKQINEMNKKQKELEIVIKHLISDNQNLRNQNAKLWRKIQKTMEKSDKKLEKLIMFLLFGHQNMLQLQDNSKKSILESQSQISVDESQSRIKNNSNNGNLVNNILSMLDSNNGISNIKNMLKYMFQEKQKSNQIKKNYTIVKNKMNQQVVVPQQHQESVQNLYLKQNGEQNNQQPQQQKYNPIQESHSIISDVNIFLNVNEQQDEVDHEILKYT